MNLLKVAAGMIFPLITFPYTSRILGPEGTGKVNFAFSLVAYFVLLASMGIPLYGIREVARVRDNPEELSALVQELLALHFLSTTISFVAFLLTIWLNHKVHIESILFLIVSASIPLSMLSMEWLYQGLEEYVYITLRGLFFAAVSVVALFLFVHHEGDYWINAVISVVASLGSSVLNFWNARSTIFAPRIRHWNLTRHLKPLSVVFALNFIISIYVNLDTVMLGFMSTARSVGFYASAMRLTKMLLAIVTSFGSVLLPRLAWYVANNKREEFDKVLRKSLGVVLLLCIPITAALMLLSREILLILAGARYLPSVHCVQITAPVILFIALTNIFGIQVLYPLGREKDVVCTVGLGAIISAVLNFILIPRMAQFGAAWATFWAESAVLATQLVLVNRYYKILWPWKNIASYAVATTIMSAFLLGMRYLIPESNLWLRLVLDVPIGIAIYFSLLLALREEFVAEVLSKSIKRFAGT